MTGREQLLADYGLPLVSAGSAIEGDTAMILGGSLAHRGHFPVWAAIATGASAAWLVDQTLLHAGGRMGRTRRVAGILARPQVRGIVGRALRHPVPVILGYRFVWGTRTVTPLALGAAGINPLKFALPDFVAAMSWAGFFGGVGYGLAATIRAAMGDLGSPDRLVVVIALALALVAAGALAYRRYAP